MTLVAQDTQTTGRFVIVQPEDIVVDTQSQEDADLAEAKTKKIGNRTHSRGDFLVVEDPDKPSTWHLPVKESGVIKRNLAGAAWAALFSSGGFRGSKYAGPDKASAKRKLKALYKAQEWELPAGELAASDNGAGVILTEGPFTFASLRARRAADEAAMEVRDLAYSFQDLAWSIFNSPDVDVVAAMRELADEFVDLVAEAVGEITESNAVLQTEAVLTEFSEQSTGSIVAITDLAEQLPDADNAPLQLDIAVIEPGWGNQKDNHYYPREMLEAAAKTFTGAKMYATNHKPDEKSVLTEVSQVLACPVGFTDSGAPIARVGIFNEDFAASIRNRATLGQLEGLNVSILASGLAKPGFELDGRQGKLIESITAVASVDWVTKAGAGGRALRLAEDEGKQEVDDMTGEQVQGTSVTSATPAANTTNVAAAQSSVINDDKVIKPVTTTTEPVAATEAVTVAEGEKSPQDAAQPGDTGLQEKEGTGDDQPTALSEAEVQATLSKATLPDVSQARLSAVQYENQDTLAAAVTQEIAYVEALTGAGRPLGQSVSDQQPAQQGSEEALTAELDAIDKRFDLKVQTRP